MKHLKLSVILLGVVLIIGCSMEPNAPKLISPQDGEVFDMIPPTFIWSSEEYAEGYAIIVDETPSDLSGILGLMPFSDELADTSVTMPQEAFDLLNNITYYWHVASFWTEESDTMYNWSEWRSFVVQKPGEPSAPQLISPEDGAVFETNPPIFIWSFDSLTAGCVIRIYAESSTTLEDTLQDTAYTMSIEMFDTLENGTYSWAAANLSKLGELFWSNSRTFILNKPVDLDTTYFPLGVGYEWCFQRYERSEGDNGEGEVWDYECFDTFTVSVVDSFWKGDTMCFTLETEKNLYQMPGMLPYCHWDLYGEARVYEDRIYLVIWMTMVDLVPDPTSLPDFMSYRGDILYSSYDYWDPHTTEYISIRRLRGIGILSQTHNYWFAGDIPPYPYAELYETDRLLYFYNGRDTVYKAED